jgi:acyl dehydratase
MLKTCARLYFEDLYVGQRFSSAPSLIDDGQIKRFAAEFDPQVFHLNEEAAGQSFFGSLAASGWHTAALTMRMIAESVPLAGGVIGAGGEIAWPKPTRPGMSLEVFTEIVATKTLRSKPDRGIVTIRCETREQTGDVVQHLTATLIVRKREPLA